MNTNLVTKVLLCILLAGTVVLAETVGLASSIGEQDTTPPYTVMTIGGPTYQSGGADRVTNGGFESDFSGWVTSGLAAVETGAAHGGSKNLKLGPGTASAYQVVTISGSASRATLTFWYKLGAYLASAGCQIRTTGGNVLVVPFTTSSGTVAQWTKFTVDVTRFRGQTIQIYFFSSTYIYGSSTLWLDDVSLKEDEIIWIRNSNTLGLIARDDLSGVDYTQYSINDGPWNTYSTPFTLVGQPEGFNQIVYRSADKSSNVEWSTGTILWVDSNAPKSVLQIGNPNLILGGTEQAVNGSFESGLNGWSVSGSAATTNTQKHSGSWCAKVGETGPGKIWQDVPIPSSANKASASLWLKFTGSTASNVILSIKDPVTGLSCWGIAWSSSMDEWTKFAWDVTRFRGSSVRLECQVVVSGGGVPATLYVDDVTVRADGDVYVSDSSLMSISSSELVGVDRCEYNIDFAGFIEGRNFGLAGSGFHSVQYRATDYLGNAENAIQTTMYLDDDGPTGSILINNGAACTASPNVVLNLSASDPVGVTHMCILSDSGVWGNWQQYQSILAYTFSTTDAGYKTIGVRFKDAFGNTSSEYTDAIEYRVPNDVDIAGAKMLPDGSAVRVVGKIVSAIFASQGYFYISEPARTSGIRVRANVMPSSVGVPVDVVGIMATQSAEREIVADELNESGPSRIIAPMGMTNARLGGAAFYYQPSVPDGATGLSNIGLLVTTCGRVISVENGNFYIDDGSKVLDGFPKVGVLVCGSDVGITAPAPGQYVVVTGISGASMVDSKIIRVLRPRNSADVRVQ